MFSLVLRICGGPGSVEDEELTSPRPTPQYYVHGSYPERFQLCAILRWIAMRKNHRAKLVNPSAVVGRQLPAFRFVVCIWHILGLSYRFVRNRILMCLSTLESGIDFPNKYIDVAGE